MIDGIEIIKYNLIVNFILFILLLVFAFLAYNAEKENSSIRYSPEKSDRYCYPDISCHNPSSIQNSQVNFTIGKYSNSLTDQDITFQYYNSSGGISEQVFNVYLGPSSALPAGVISYLGLCAGYLNYSSTGTSIYLYHYFDNNGACWNTANTHNIAALFSLAFNGTSSYLDNNNDLINHGDNILTYSLDNTFTGVSIYSSETGPSSLIDIASTTTLNLAPISGQQNDPTHSTVMNYYQNAIKISRFGASSGNSGHRRCIDPSYASQFICGDPSSKNDGDVYYNDAVKLYVRHENLGITSGISPCKVIDGETPYKDNCGVPFCYAGTPADPGKGQQNKQSYQQNSFSVNGEIKSTSTPTYLYKGKNIFATDGIYSGVTPDNFGNYVQAQGLLFCGGTTTTTNNATNDAYSSSSGKFPQNANSNNTPEMATQPNRPIIKGNKVILGFK
jgi:hypothetical protein